MLERARREYSDCSNRVEALSTSKAEILIGYDAPGMMRAATICHWGRSGSVLLASYLDNHPDIITLPNQTSEYIYHFYRDYPTLSLWEKLVVYPFYSASKKGNAGDFFLRNNPDGDYAIEREDYFASTVALARMYRDLPEEALNSRAWFFRSVHLAYFAALGKRADNPRPLMVSAQHWFSEELAAMLAEDFPGAQFLHTIRDPISAFDSWLERHFTWQFGDGPPKGGKYLSPSFDAYKNLLSWDKAHRGAGTRTRAVRFEDMHLRPEELMRKLAAWLQVRFLPSMVESTLSGRPYIVKSGGVSWVGANPKNARRRSGNLSLFDRLLLFALLRRNFKVWDYPESRVFGWRLIGWAVIAFGALIPTRRELTNARLNATLQAGPALREGRRLFASLLPLFVIKRRVQFAVLIWCEAADRTVGKRAPMKII